MGNRLTSSGDFDQDIAKSTSGTTPGTPKNEKKFKFLPTSTFLEEDSFFFSSEDSSLFPASISPESEMVNIDLGFAVKPDRRFDQHIFVTIAQFCNTKTFISMSRVSKFFYVTSHRRSFPNTKYTLKSEARIHHAISHVANLDCSNAIYVTDQTLKRFYNVQILNISRCELLTGNAFRNLEFCRVLNMSWCRQEAITGKVFAGLKVIETLNLEGCIQITGDSFEHVKGIKSLNVKDCIQLKDDAIQRLDGSLRYLNIAGTELTDVIFQNLSNLEILNISGCQNITDAAFKGLRKLKKLKVSNCLQLDGTFLQYLSGVEELDMVGLNQSCFKESTFELLFNCKSLQYLDIKGCDQIQHPLLERLRKAFPNLKE